MKKALISLFLLFSALCADPLFFTPFTAEEFVAYCEAFQIGYSTALVKAEICDEELAQEKAKSLIDSAWAGGYPNAQHCLYSITLEDRIVGKIWYTPFIPERKMAWLFDIEIDPSFQRKGFGRASLEKMEGYLKDQGINRIGLQVFASNTLAKTLYESLGYQVTGYLLCKNSQEIACYLMVKNL